MKRYKETVIGLSFIAAIILLFAGISFLKGRNIFSNKAIYYIRCLDVTGLSDASPIYTNGVRIGIVDDIHYDPKHPDDIFIRILLDRRLPVTEGSTALLETELLGSVNINLLLNTKNSTMLSPGDTLPGILDKGLMDEVAQVMPALTSLVQKADTLIASAQILLEDSALVEIVHNTEALTSDARIKLAELSELMGQLSSAADTYTRMGVHLDTVATHIADAAQEIREEEWMDRISEVINNLDTLSTLLKDDKGTAGKIMTDAQLYDDIDATCQEAKLLIEDVRQHPGRYIKLFGRDR